MKFAIATSFSDPAHLTPIARAAEECGWDALTFSDHIVHPEKMESQYPYTADGGTYWDAANPWPDPWVTIGALAAVTERLRFTTNVFILPARDPILVAKAVGTAAVLSGDRVALGIGVGWMKEEFEIVGQDFHTRGKRTDEAIDILRLLWAGGMVEYHGKHYEFPRMQMSPAPARPIPIYVGGLSAPALRRAARCDGWISVMHTTEEIRVYADKLQALRVEQDNTDGEFDILVSATDVRDLDGYKRLADAGATGVVTAPWRYYHGDTLDLQEKLDGIRRYADDIIHRF
ncbi:MAG: LLM class F420-dependent oxidoreductase [Candidatus Binatia bacterium]